MLKQGDLVRELEREFTPPQATLLARVITTAYNDLVKTSDFSELKGIVAELAKAQQRTELRVEELAQAQQRTEQRLEQLAQAQQRTELRVEQLAQAQQRTEQRLEQLAQAQRDLAVAQQRTEQVVRTLVRGLADTRAELGGLARSVRYALENEAYRALPRFLAERYGIRVTDRLIRTELDGEEIDFFGHAIQNDREVLLVGEVKLRLDERRKVRTPEGTTLRAVALLELEHKLDVVRRHYPDLPLVPLLVTHYARPAILKEAAEHGVIVVQSFEW